MSKKSRMFEKIRGWYEAGIWNREMVKNAVVKGKITRAEYEEITGEAWAE